MKKYGALIMMLLICSFLITSCAKNHSGNRPDIPGKVITNPETTLKIGSELGDAVLPTISELKWNFYKIPDTENYRCKMNMKAKFNDSNSYMARIELLDYNNFPVTIQQQKLSGAKNEEVEYNVELYIEPKLSKKITKARVVLEVL